MKQFLVVIFSILILGFLAYFLSTSPRFREPEVCIQVITRAEHRKTGEIKDFPTPCDVPKGWDIVVPGDDTLIPLSEQ